MLKVWVGIVLLLAGVVGAVELTDLRCDYRVNPLAVELKRPGLSWKLVSDRQGAAQTAYQIQASPSEETLDNAELWDSGWVESSKNAQVFYEGKPVPPAGRVCWRVRVEDEQGRVSDWSSPAWFEIGLKTEAEWRGAEWISCTRELKPLLAPEDVMGPWIGSSEKGGAVSLTYRASFDVPDKPVVYAGAWWGTSVLVRNECSVNGQSAKFRFRYDSPQYTDYSFHICPGKNRIELYIPDSPRDNALCFGMRIVFADGTEQMIRSSSEWTVDVGKKAVGKKRVKGAQSPLRMVCKYGKAPLGEAKVYGLSPLPVTCIKQVFI